MKTTRIGLLLGLLLLASSARAWVVLPRVLGHHMVLQRNQPVPIWGTAAPGEAVTVTFGAQQLGTTANAAGRWQVTLKPLRASAVPAELVIAGRNTIRLQNILVGEVWLCSGQSNMEYTMRKNSKVTIPATEDAGPLAELEHARNPALRIFLVNRKELAKPDSLHRGWSIAQDSALRAFSAPAYFFAKELYAHLHVPVGVISSAVPGSRIEPWIAEQAFAQDAYYASQKVDGDPGKFYEPMIRPLVPFAVRGFLWYQGESNCFLAETSTYTHKLQTLIQSWRAAWHNDQLPFYFVQLAPFLYSESKDPRVPLTRETLPRFREAQQAVLRTPHTGMIVTTDLVTKLDDIHPPYKWKIGQRLALLALSGTYRRPKAEGVGPVFRRVRFRKNEAVVSFEPLKSRLTSKDGQPLTDFTLAGADGVFVPAQARIAGQRVVVSAPGVAKPVAVRFGWDEAAKPNLFSAAGLPARPFRTDTLPPSTPPLP
ncbi:sialate O-acetylesterase [Hymenobacter cellulosivorans]|uniref:Sialate O-acetylesterase n=1 Tax=Hymenobacter cellulosivorans TaxID=2932249 RepID=A0ABY4F4D5_9BACT|nr:sialate O-acetylesterase [Hymenobacter cellulosivorans]UOQ51091.1 sialate O-acetylesterase [Hymenobacter cellulosivorans]